MSGPQYLNWGSLVLYSEIPLLRPHKTETSYLLETSFEMFKLCFSSFSTPSVPLIRDHLWDCPKVVLKPLLDSPKGGLNIGILLYLKYNPVSFPKILKLMKCMHAKKFYF